MNVNQIKSPKLIIERQLERLHKNVSNIIMHLLNLDPFLTEIKAPVKEIMVTISDDWDIKSSIPQATLKKRKEAKE